MNFLKEDRTFMDMAIKEAKISLDEGNFPVGAVLVIDGKLVGKDRNSIHSNKDWISHAEIKLLSRYSSLIKKEIKNKNSIVKIYTSLEPCLMCFGASVLNRISRIVYACPDPFTGALNIHLNDLPIGYKKMWPKISSGLMKEDSYNLVTACMQKQGTNKWNKALDLYKKLK
ncbi:MAG: nucleoside deaminase [Minisyncoccia bacterium]